MDHRDFVVPVATEGSQNNSGSASIEDSRPRSASASIHYASTTDNGGDTPRAVAGDAVGFHNISGNLGLTTVNSDSPGDGFLNSINNDEVGDEELYTNGNVVSSGLLSGTILASDNSKSNFSSVNSWNSNGFITKPTKVRNSSIPRYSVLDSGANIKSSSDIPKLDLTHNLPPLTDTITYGFGVKMVASSSCQQLIYRSVPPRPLSFAFTDVLDSKRSMLRSKTAPVSTNSPEDYAQRFKSRPTTRPKVVEFDGSTVSSKTKRFAIGAAFPTTRAKVYIGHQKNSVQNIEPASSRAPPTKLYLGPLAPGTATASGFVNRNSRGLRTPKLQGADSLHGNQTAHTTRTFTQSANSSSPGRPVKSSTSLKQSETSRSVEFLTTVNRVDSPDADDHIYNPDMLLSTSTDCDDLSVLPPPKKVLPRREVPWVFRYKVKKGMNTLSRIMASRPSPNALQSSYTFT